MNVIALGKESGWKPKKETGMHDRRRYPLM